jgi:3-hydroxymyristoyl/3-hydroxydecanoyl-(acyl carrier protein) dehydratase
MPPLLHDALSDTIQLSFEQTVPRSLVHKRSLENVLLTEISACAEDRFLCAGRVPTAHRFFNDRGRTPHADILFYTELGRQASLAISHAFLNVSRDDAFIFEGSDAALAEGAWIAARDSSLDAVVILIKAREITRRRNDAVSRVVAEHVMWIGGQQVFQGTGAWTIQSAALFQRLRRTSTARAVPGEPGTVSHRAAPAPRARLPHACGDNVVISPPWRGESAGEFVSSLIVDHTHPYFFDHPCDHVPGMLLLEGCAQLALAACSETGGAADAARVRAYDMAFAQFVECGTPATLTAYADAADGANGRGRRQGVRVVVSQHDVVCGTATIDLAAAIAA